MENSSQTRGQNLQQPQLQRRNGIRLMAIFSSVHLVQEVIEPIIRLILDLLTMILLGLTFCIQSISVIISLDSVISGIFKTISRNLASIISSFSSLCRSESERKAIATSFVNYFANIIWVIFAYRVNLDNWYHFYPGPMVYFGVLNALVQVYLIRNQITMNLNLMSWNRSMLLSLLIILSLSMCYQAGRVSVRSFPVTLLLMKPVVNSLCQGMQLITSLLKHQTSSSDNDVIVIPPSLAQQQEGIQFTASNNGYLDIGGDISIHLIEIMRAMLWTFVSIYQYSICIGPPLLVSTTSINGLSNLSNTTIAAATTTTAISSSFHYYNDRKDRWFFLLILAHDFIHLFVPMRRLTMKLIKDSFIASQFSRLSREDLSTLSSDDRCAICLCDHNTSSVRLPCQHILHHQCLNRILQDGNAVRRSRCPICRADILPSSNNNDGSSANNGNSILAALLGVNNGGLGGGGGGNGNFNGGPGHVYELRDVIRVRIISPTTLATNTTTTSHRPSSSAALPQNASINSSSAINPTTNNSSTDTTNSNNNNNLFERRNTGDRVTFRRIIPMVNLNNHNPFPTTVPPTSSSTTVEGQQQPSSASQLPQQIPVQQGVQYIRVNLNNRTLADTTLGALLSLVDEMERHQNLPSQQLQTEQAQSQQPIQSQQPAVIDSIPSTSYDSMSTETTSSLPSSSTPVIEVEEGVSSPMMISSAGNNPATTDGSSQQLPQPSSIDDSAPSSNSDNLPLPSDDNQISSLNNNSSSRSSTRKRTRKESEQKLAENTAEESITPVVDASPNKRRRKASSRVTSLPAEDSQVSNPRRRKSSSENHDESETPVKKEKKRKQE